MIHVFCVNVKAEQVRGEDETRPEGEDTAAVTLSGVHMEFSFLKETSALYTMTANKVCGAVV